MEQQPQVMGILNVTPDSFFDGGKHNTVEEAIAHGIRLYEEGADLIDIGGESTRPGAAEVSVNEEIARVIPVIKALKKEIPLPLSIDTKKSIVAAAAVEAGASLINDVSGFSSPEMVKVAVESQSPICVMHMQGTPKTMQYNPSYPKGITAELTDWFTKKIEMLTEMGIQKEQIILDPGIGFGKTVDDNLEILHNLQRFKALGCRLLIGLSRKSFLTKITGLPSTEALPPTIAMNTVALMQGADIIRVHDVAEHRAVVDVYSRWTQLRDVCV